MNSLAGLVCYTPFKQGFQQIEISSSFLGKVSGSRKYPQFLGGGAASWNLLHTHTNAISAHYLIYKGALDLVGSCKYQKCPPPLLLNPF